MAFKRIINPLIEFQLWACHGLTRHPFFAPIHQAVRRLYVGPFTRALEAWLRSDLRMPGLELKVRQSASHSGKDFNIFASDLDYAVIVPGDPEPMHFGWVAERYRFYRGRFRFLGELEMYSKEEWLLRQTLELDHGVFLKGVWLLRKLNWQKLKRLTEMRPYHRQKARLSFQAALGKLGFPETESVNFLPEAYPQGLGQGISRSIASWIDPRTLRTLQLIAPTHGQPPRTASRYLGVPLGETAWDSPALELDWIGWLCLMSILPAEPGDLQCDSGHPGAPALRQARSIESLRELRRVLILWEALLCQSVQRTSASERQANLGWLHSLQAEMSKDQDCFGALLNRMEARALQA